MLLHMLPIALAITTALSFSSPQEITPRQDVDASVLCGRFDNVTEGPYTLFLNQLGADDLTSRSQCAEITSLNGTTISWTTNWTWAGGNGVKSFASVGLDAAVGRQIRGITNLPTSWDWFYNITNASVANVAYDLLTSTSPGGDTINEIMVWLASFNAQPISSQTDEEGEAVPAITNINIMGESWNMFSGSNGATSVFTFLPTNGTIQSFHSDLNAFIKFLILNVGLDQSQFLKAAQAGTQVTSGSGTLTVSGYGLTVT